LRRISFLDTETGKRLIFITNNFEIDAIVIAKIYKARWRDVASSAERHRALAGGDANGANAEGDKRSATERREDGSV
jgi:hypothetical protein